VQVERPVRLALARQVRLTIAGKTIPSVTCGALMITTATVKISSGTSRSSTSPSSPSKRIVER